MGSGSSEGTPKANLGSAFKHRDDHDIGDSYRTHQKRDGSQTQEQGVECALGCGARNERG